ncbi:hypothetical protein ACFWNQ_25085 [Streptomyces virginiae]|uniref:hypothetical protein n=1 Tax=Streptomyces virginiae TaxID=1961 RepID=UPI0036478FB5
MSQRTLARGRQAGWAHPYRTGPFSSVFYADGGDGVGSDSTSDDGDGGQSDDTGDETGDGQQADTKSDADDTGKSAKKDTAKGGQDEDPAVKIARLERELKSANAEAGKARTTAKQQAADEARTALVQELGKALGLVKDDDKGAAPPDPAKLTAEIERATAAHRQTATELAVFKGASKHGADPDGLTDSRAFMAKLAKLDPAGDDFTKKVNEAIKAAVADNPKLKAGQAPASSSGDFTGGTGEPDSTGPRSIDDIRAERRKRRTG